MASSSANRPSLRTRSAPSTATASPAPKPRSSTTVSGVPLALAGCLEQRGHFWPTTVLTMQRGQIGSPQLEQVRRVSTPGWLTHAGTTGAGSTLIASSAYLGARDILARAAAPPLGARCGIAWYRIPLASWRQHSVWPCCGARSNKEARRADGHVPHHPGVDRRLGSRRPDGRAL